VSLVVQLTLFVEKKLFMLEEARKAHELAECTENVVYSWKTSGHSNWLEKGGSLVDVLGFVVLPHGLPPIIEMADDPLDI